MGIDELGPLIKDLNAVLDQQSEQLAALRSTMDEQSAQLDDFVPKRNYRVTVALLVTAGLLVLALVLVLRSERNRVLHADRLVGATQGYGNCVSVNRTLDGVDRGYLLVGDVLREASTSPERADAIVAALRAGLHRTDCSGHLMDLSAKDAERVRDEASRTLPTLPLPPPPPR